MGVSSFISDELLAGNNIEKDRFEQYFIVLQPSVHRGPRRSASKIARYFPRIAPGGELWLNTDSQ
jgi:hypothetical protein